MMIDDGRLDDGRFRECGGGGCSYLIMRPIVLKRPGGQPHVVQYSSSSQAQRPGEEMVQAQ